MKVDRPKADSHFYHLWLECSQTYDFIVLGWNERGHSDLDEGLMVVISTEKGKSPDMFIRRVTNS